MQSMKRFASNLFPFFGILLSVAMLVLIFAMDHKTINNQPVELLGNLFYMLSCLYFSSMVFTFLCHILLLLKDKEGKQARGYYYYLKNFVEIVLISFFWQMFWIIAEKVARRQGKKSLQLVFYAFKLN